MVIYGVLAQVSIGDLFLAGIIPGFVIGLLLMGMVYYLVTLGGVYAPVQPRTPWPALGRAFVRAVPPLAAPVLLVAGLLAGVIYIVATILIFTTPSVPTSGGV
jgi:TRAP-type C4-dicarboxylate transport system permease large subunit